MGEWPGWRCEEAGASFFTQMTNAYHRRNKQMSVLIDNRDAWAPDVIDTAVVPRPYPNRTGRLPWNKDDMTAERLTGLLQNKYPGIVVEDLVVHQFIDSHTSKLRIAVKLNDVGVKAGIPERLCIKSNYSGLHDNVDICAIEARFYHFMAHLMKCPTVTCYYADWDDDGSGQGLIILEDLEKYGGHFGQSTDLNGVAEVAKLLEGLAVLHGSLWGSPVLDEHEWLQTSMDTPIDNDQIRIMWPYIEANLADPEVCKVIPQKLIDDPDRLQRAFDKLAEWELSQTTPRCVNLGDCHQGNTYRKPDGERIWLDWQLVRKGRPWRDLTYLMIGALTIEERRASERQLLSHYREALVATGARDVPDLDSIFEQYRRWVIYGMQAWIANMDFWGQVGLPMNERFFTAGEDLGTWKLLLGD